MEGNKGTDPPGRPSSIVILICILLTLGSINSIVLCDKMWLLLVVNWYRGTEQDWVESNCLIWTIMQQISFVSLNARDFLLRPMTPKEKCWSVWLTNFYLSMAWKIDKQKWHSSDFNCGIQSRHLGESSHPYIQWIAGQAQSWHAVGLWCIGMTALDLIFNN